MGNDISKVLLSITVIDINECKEKEIMRNEINFFIEIPICQVHLLYIG